VDLWRQAAGAVTDLANWADLYRELQRADQIIE